ncbi:hypothetical protein ACS0TY_007911 [Phlomoides rotata]
MTGLGGVGRNGSRVLVEIPLLLTLEIDCVNLAKDYRGEEIVGFNHTEYMKERIQGKRNLNDDLREVGEEVTKNKEIVIANPIYEDSVINLLPEIEAFAINKERKMKHGKVVEPTSVHAEDVPTHQDNIPLLEYKHMEDNHFLSADSGASREGLGHPTTIPFICELVRARRPVIIFLFETLSLGYRLEELRVKLGFDSCFNIDCIGHIGGISILWKASSIFSVLDFSQNHIDLKVLGPLGDWRVIRFYGFPSRAQRQSSWNLLR